MTAISTLYAQKYRSAQRNLGRRFPERLYSGLGYVPERQMLPPRATLHARWLLRTPGPCLLRSRTRLPAWNGLPAVRVTTAHVADFAAPRAPTIAATTNIANAEHSVQMADETVLCHNSCGICPAGTICPKGSHCLAGGRCSEVGATKCGNGYIYGKGALVSAWRQMFIARRCAASPNKAD